MSQAESLHESLDTVVESGPVSALITVLHGDKQAVVQTPFSPEDAQLCFQGLQHDADAPPHHFYIIVPSVFGSMEPVLQHLRRVIQRTKKRTAPLATKPKNLARPSLKKRKLSTPPTTNSLVESVLAAHVSGSQLGYVKFGIQRLMKRSATSPSDKREVIGLIGVGVIPVAAVALHVIPYLKRENFAALVKDLHQPVQSKQFRVCLKKLLGFYGSTQTKLPKPTGSKLSGSALLNLPGNFVVVKDSQTGSILFVSSITDPALIGNLPMEVSILSSQQTLARRTVAELTGPKLNPVVLLRDTKSALAKISLLVSMFGDAIGRHLVQKYLYFFKVGDYIWEFLLQLPLNLWTPSRLSEAIQFAKMGERDAQITSLTQKMCQEFTPLPQVDVEIPVRNSLSV